MPRHYLSKFNLRQYMEAKDFEIFYYEDKILSDVSLHRHDFYEIYFFINGNVSIMLNEQEYPLQYGNVCIIPPLVKHRPVFYNNSEPYRRIVLWLSPAYLDKLFHMYDDINYCFIKATKDFKYHYSFDFGAAQLLYSKLISIIEEYQSAASFHNSLLDSYIVSFLLCLNRVIYNAEEQSLFDEPASLFTNICEYISSHLEEPLTLDMISSYFHVSKYYVSHLFKQSMGLSTHKYILKKRLNASKNDIHSGIPLQDVCRSYGFKDYTGFFRAFKKEFGLSPSKYKDTFYTPVPHEHQE